MTNNIVNGKTYKIKSGEFKNCNYIVEDLCENVLGRSWVDHRGNPACLQYMMRTIRDKLPVDNNVYYGKIGLFGYLVHESEIGEEIKE